MDEAAKDVQNNGKSKKRVAIEDGVYEKAGNDKKGKMNASHGNEDGCFAGRLGRKGKKSKGTGRDTRARGRKKCSMAFSAPDVEGLGK
jgi:hypothetical protein